MHSGILIVAWMAGVAVIQVLSPVWLLVALGGCALAAWQFAPARSARLMRRVRYLLIAILVLFAGFTPGEALWAELPLLSPSREGAMLAAEHAGRLIAVVLCVALLLEGLPVSRLVSGLYALLRPFRLVGMPAERLAVRLMLVLRYVESAPHTSWESWLQQNGVRENDAGELIVIRRERIAAKEIALLGLVVVAWLGVWW